MPTTITIWCLHSRKDADSDTDLDAVAVPNTPQNDLEMHRNLLQRRLEGANFKIGVVGEHSSVCW